jgi:Uma2 family endonuclease
MTAVTVAQRMTAEEYLALGGPPEGRPRTELIDGEVVVNDPRPLHQIVALDLISALWAWTKARAGRGTVLLPLDVQLDERNVFNPDILWYAAGRGPTRHTQPPSPLPDLAVEVRSPSTWRYDIGAKKARYERHGLPELWLVDTAADEVLVFRRSAPAAASFDLALELGRGEVLVSPMLPGFSQPIEELFSER